MNRRMNRLINVWMYRWIDEEVNKRLNRLINVWMNRWINK